MGEKDKNILFEKANKKYNEGLVLSKKNPEAAYKCFTEATNYYKEAADLGNSFAMNSYANMLYNGKGILENKQEAIKYYKMAINSGNTFAMNNYADMLANGNGISIDRQEAIKYYKMAIDNNNINFILFIIPDKEVFTQLFKERNKNIIDLLKKSKIKHKLIKNKNNEIGSIEIENINNDDRQGKNQVTINRKINFDENGNVANMIDIACHKDTSKKLYEIKYNEKGKRLITYFNPENGRELITAIIDENGIIKFNFDNEINLEILKQKINEILNSFSNNNSFDDVLSYLKYAPIQLIEKEEIEKESINFNIKCLNNLENTLNIINSSLNEENRDKLYICDFAYRGHCVQLLISNGEITIINTGMRFNNEREIIDVIKEIKIKFKEKFPKKANRIRITESVSINQSTGNCTIASKMDMVEFLIKIEKHNRKRKRLIEINKRLIEIKNNQNNEQYNKELAREYEKLMEENIKLTKKKTISIYTKDINNKLNNKSKEEIEEEIKIAESEIIEFFEIPKYLNEFNLLKVEKGVNILDKKYNILIRKRIKASYNVYKNHLKHFNYINQEIQNKSNLVLNNINNILNRKNELFKEFNENYNLVDRQNLYILDEYIKKNNLKDFKNLINGKLPIINNKAQFLKALLSFNSIKSNINAVKFLTEDKFFENKTLIQVILENEGINALDYLLDQPNTEKNWLIKELIDILKIYNINKEYFKENKNLSFKTILHDAALKGDYNTIVFLIEKFGIDANIKKNSSFKTLFQIAVETENKDIFNYLMILKLKTEKEMKIKKIDPKILKNNIRLDEVIAKDNKTILNITIDKINEYIFKIINKKENLNKEEIKNKLIKNLYFLKEIYLGFNQELRENYHKTIACNINWNILDNFFSEINLKDYEKQIIKNVTDIKEYGATELIFNYIKNKENIVKYIIASNNNAIKLNFNKKIKNGKSIIDIINKESATLIYFLFNEKQRLNYENLFMEKNIGCDNYSDIRQIIFPILNKFINDKNTECIEYILKQQKIIQAINEENNENKIDWKKLIDTSINNNNLNIVASLLLSFKKENRKNIYSFIIEKIENKKCNFTKNELEDAIIKLNLKDRKDCKDKNKKNGKNNDFYNYKNDNGDNKENYKDLQDLKYNYKKYNIKEKHNELKEKLEIASKELDNYNSNIKEKEIQKILNEDPSILICEVSKEKIKIATNVNNNYYEGFGI